MLASHIRARRREAAGPAGGVARSAASGGTLIPYDYAAKFEIKGRPGNVVQDVIAISPDSVFVAVAIGYGFEQERTLPLEVSWQSRTDLAAGEGIAPAQVRLSQLPHTAQIEGFRVNPHFDNVMFDETQPGGGERDFSARPISRDLTDFVFQRMRPPADISFLFSMIDSSNGRELQDEPLLALSSLGSAKGERPFRPLAQPLSFLPRSTVRMQVIERTPGISGWLFIVLYGYKILIGAACPEPAAQSLVEAAIRKGSPTAASDSVIPFDYVAKVQLTGRENHRLEDEITISTEGPFVATSIGYGLLVEEEEDVALSVDRIPDAIRAAVAPVVNEQQRVNLSLLPLSAFPPEALLDGIRIREEYLRIAYAGGGALADGVPIEIANRIFKRINCTEDVSFRYTIYDSGTGQAWMNMPTNNLASLGEASGQRPFKRLARPMIFRPRSTLRVTVDEHFGRGWLYLALQGYKLLGSARGGAA